MKNMTIVITINFSELMTFFIQFFNDIYQNRLAFVSNPAYLHFVQFLKPDPDATIYRLSSHQPKSLFLSELITQILNIQLSII